MPCHVQTPVVLGHGFGGDLYVRNLRTPFFFFLVSPLRSPFSLLSAGWIDWMRIYRNGEYVGEAQNICSTRRDAERALVFVCACAGKTVIKSQA